jgi:uncharacterized protein YdbL (DUF1318 family)
MSVDNVREGVASALLAVLVTGCLAVTVNVTFPQEKIDNAASSIEDLVRTPKQAPGGPPRTRLDPRSAEVPRDARWWAWFGPAVAEAQVPELKTRTPQVMAAVESRQNRFPQLSAAMTSGCVGENTQGLVEARPGANCPPNVAALVGAENADRMLIYRTLVEQNNMPPGDIVRVQAAFAKANREKAPPGAWVQTDAGQWTRK